MFVLLFAIAAMHAGVFAIGPGTQPSVHEHGSVAAMHTHSHSNTAAAGHKHPPGHGAMHECVFILSAVTFALALVLLYKLGYIAPPDGRRLQSLSWQARLERPPPWTMPCLAELSILRI